MSWRRLLRAALLIAAAVVLAPLFYAVGKGLFAGGSEGERRSQSIALLAAYRDHLPRELLMPGRRNFGLDIARCGYREEQLFPAGERQFANSDLQWTPYEGYFDLLMERDREWNQRLELMRLTRLDTETSGFSSEFLRVCMRQSLFAPVCAGRVRAILGAADLDVGNPAWPHGLPRPDQSRQTRNICIYLDGLAARRGLPLAARPQ
jgi:hypothetical protein